MTRKIKQVTAKKLQDCQGALSHLAVKDEDARRRYQDEDDDAWLFEYGSPFDLDVEKGLNSKGIRRMQKTQVIAEPKNAHTRNRLVHTFEVIAVARTLARILGLNESLAHAGALLHDIGHTPLGHRGERFLNQVHDGAFFRHEIFGCILVQRIERMATGLNPTMQTLDCIRYHSRGAGSIKPSGVSQEADLVMYSDKLSYVFADYSDIFGRRDGDAIQLNVGDFPGLAALVNWFGCNQREQVQTAMTALCLESADKGKVSFVESEAAQKFAELKKKMYEVYPRIYPHENYATLKEFYDALAEAVPNANTTVLFALMEDNDILRLLPKAAIGQVLRREDLKGTAVDDALPYISKHKFDLRDPGLDW